MRGVYRYKRADPLLLKTETRMSKVNSEQITKTQLLVAGLKKNVELVKNKGIDEQFISRLEADCKIAAAYDEENDKLKEQLRAKTRLINSKIDEIKEQVANAKKVIKKDFDQTRWLNFGISDKR
jgi:surfactin synthase thioesterase subunit